MDRNELETKLQEAANRQSPKPYEKRHLDLEIRPAAGRKRRVCVWRRVFARAGTDGACCSHGRTALLLSLLLVVVLAVEDNLVKGAAGQAVQNMNLMFGLKESEGLELVPMFP